MKKIKTHFQEIDDILNANNGEGKLISLGARPGMGKTTFVINLAKNIAKLNDVKILIFSLEESKEKLEVLFFQNLRCAPQEFSKIHIDEKPTPSIDYIEETITQFDNPAIVIIDYIALINGYTVGLQNEILCKLKNICKNKNISIIYTCQLSRKLERNIDKRPYLDNFDDVIIKNSDAVFALYRPAYYSCGNDPTAELRLMKNSTGGVCLIWGDQTGFQMDVGVNETGANNLAGHVRFHIALILAQTDNQTFRNGNIGSLQFTGEDIYKSGIFQNQICFLPACSHIDDMKFLDQFPVDFTGPGFLICHSQCLLYIFCQSYHKVDKK